MPCPLRIQFEGAFYHIMIKGYKKECVVNKQKRTSDIFHSPDDYQRFTEDLKFVSQAYNFIIHAFCLMSNHVHLFCETPIANLSEAMQRLNTRYKSYYNKKYKRKEGSVFRRRYKSILIDSDNYAGALSRYIHRNPIGSLVANAEEWLYSSCKDYFTGTRQYPFVEKNLVYNSFHSDINCARKMMKEFHYDESAKSWKPEDFMFGNSILGSEDFFIRHKQHIKELQNDCEFSGLAFLKQSDKLPSLKKFISDLKLPWREQRNYLAYALRTKTAMNTQEINDELGLKLSASALANRIRRVKSKSKNDSEVAKILLAIDKM